MYDLLLSSSYEKTHEILPSPRPWKIQRCGKTIILITYGGWGWVWEVVWTEIWVKETFQSAIHLHQSWDKIINKINTMSLGESQGLGTPSETKTMRRGWQCWLPPLYLRWKGLCRMSVDCCKLKSVSPMTDADPNVIPIAATTKCPPPQQQWQILSSK